MGKVIGHLIASALIAVALAAALFAPWYLLQRINAAQSSVVSSPYEIQSQTNLLRLEVGLLELQLDDMRASQRIFAYDTFQKRQAFLLHRLKTISYLIAELKKSSSPMVYSTQRVEDSISMTSEHAHRLQEIVNAYPGSGFDTFLSQASAEVIDVKIGVTFLFSETSVLLQRVSSHTVRQLSDLATIIIVMSLLMVLVLFGLGYSLRVVYRQKDSLRRLSQLDELTGLENRRCFNQKLSGAITRAKERGSDLSLVILDVDHFKAFNDIYGHNDGDITLAKVAKALRHSVAAEQAWPFRIGGEEFACIVEEDFEYSKRLADNMLFAVEELEIPHAGSSTSQYVTVSIGLAPLSDVVNEEKAEQSLFRLADQALYEAKNNGRNRVVVNKNPT